MTTTKQYKDFTQELLLRTDIIDVIGKRINLRKAGANYVALCPFHDEKTPSFLVSPNKQFYHCFGCGASGNAISFVMAFDKLTFNETLELLASYHGLTLPSNAYRQQPEQFNEIYNLLNQVNKFYIEHLKTSSIAQQYLSKRGLSTEIIQRFGIGFSPIGWDNLAHLFHKNVKNKELLLTSGMLIRKEKSISVYSRFRNRIMFPIRNRKGNIIAYGGRCLDNELPKYLNSPETTLFHKSNELYGLYELKQSRDNYDYVIVVEGYMDVVALAQYGINNAVATLGTAVTTKQIQQLIHLYPKIVFCFDGDQAGQKASWRALENALPILSENISLFFLTLPANHDPDSFIRENNTEAFSQLINTATPCSDFLFQKLLKKNNIQKSEGKAKLISEARELFDKIPNGVFKQVLLQQLSTTSKIDISSLHQNQQISYKNNPYNTNRINYTNNQRNNLKKAEPTNFANFATHKNTVILNPFHQIINLLFSYPYLVNNIDVNIYSYLNKIKDKNNDAKLLQQLISLLKEQYKLQSNNDSQITNKSINLGQIIEKWRNSENFNLIVQLASHSPIVHTTDENLNNEFNAILHVLHKHSIDQIIQNILTVAKTRELTEEEKIKLQELIKLHK